MRITHYTPQDDGSYKVVIEGVPLGNDETLSLDNEIPVEVDVSIHSPYRITDKQRRKIFALVNDIEAHTGQPREYMRAMFQDYTTFIYGYREPISLATCDKKAASRTIDLIIEWVFQHDIPLNYRTSDLLKNDLKFLYLATINRQCVICGRQKSDLAHRYAIGRGRNRNTMNHHGNQVLALCRSHHNEQHQIGIDSFNKKYHLEYSWIKVDDRLNKMLQGKNTY